MTLTFHASLALPGLRQGLALSFGLIVAIGAQNAFVLRQGLRREHVGSVVLFCAVADACSWPPVSWGWRRPWGRARAWRAPWRWRARRSWRSTAGRRCARAAGRISWMQSAAGSRGALGRGAALAQAAAFTLLNPHVYLDTVLLVGSIGAQQPAALRGWFIAGAGRASLVWFGLLGFGARWLAPWFARPRAWQVLDGC
jgi:L-lysine exporter family protein LysE/ArgO